jgi:hypothetical protein
MSSLIRAGFLRLAMDASLYEQEALWGAAQAALVPAE